MTKEAILSEILKLFPNERVEFLGEAWDMIVQQGDELPVPDWHVEELERRLADPNPTSVPWEQVRDRLLEREGS